MDLWTHWLQSALGYLQVHFGLSEAVAIIALTLLARAVLLPVSLTSAYRMQLNRKAIARLKPQLDALREVHKDDPSEIARRTMALYRENGIAFFDRLSLLNIGSQSMLGLGLFRTLRQMVFHSRFVWITSLARPDVVLTALVAVLMAVGMALMPGMSPSTSSLLMIAVPIVLSVIALAALPSALGIYWAASNSATIVQTLALRGLLARNARSPA